MPYLNTGYINGMNQLLTQPEATVQQMIDAHASGYLHSAFNVKSYGAVGDGSHDDTTAIQAAIDAATLVNGEVFLPVGLYKIITPLSCSGNISIRGEFVTEVWGDHLESYESLPGSAPWISGSILLQTTAGTNAINILATSINVSIFNLGIRFADAIAFNNTGHGIYAVPSEMNGLGHESGLANCRWENIIVFGHDGNHYAFYVVNQILMDCNHLRGYGGGGWHIECDSYVGAYGNSVFIGNYFALFAGGTADGYYLKSRTVTFPGDLNLLVFIRPQCNVLNATVTAIGTHFTFPIPTNAQYLWRDVGDPLRISLIAPDMECPDSIPSPCSFGANTYIHPAGSFFSAPNGNWVTYQTEMPRQSKPTLTWGIGAGQTGTVVGGLAAVSKDYNETRGLVRFTAGTAPVAGDWNEVCTITFGAYSGVGAILLQPMPAAYGEWDSPDAKFYPWFIQPGSFQVWSHAGLTAGKQYCFMYVIIP